MSAPQSTESIFTGMGYTLAVSTSWTQGFSARMGSGLPCDPCSPAARSWCIYGAMTRELGKIADPELRAQLDEEADEILHDLCNGVAPSAVNDDPETTHADILGLITRARAQSMSSQSRNA